jgi:hypothetical protein
MRTRRASVQFIAVARPIVRGPLLPKSAADQEGSRGERRSVTCAQSRLRLGFRLVRYVATLAIVRCRSTWPARSGVAAIEIDGSQHNTPRSSLFEPPG